MADAAFFGLFGLTWGTDVTEANKRDLFKELVSLFDSLHDFGTFGSVYDYVTKNKEADEYYTNRRTIFNHLRNGYTELRGYPQISKLNSQLHCFDIGFHLKASLTKAKLEDAFFNYAANNLIDARDKFEPKNFNDITPGELKEYMAAGGPLVFSVDTQKKLFAVRGLVNVYQTYDREKRCDPAGHSFEDKGGVLILTEIDNSAARTYAANGIKSATVEGASVDNAKIKIDLEGSPGPFIEMNTVGAKHKNNVSIVNTQLKAFITAGVSMPKNINVKPNGEFYSYADYSQAAGDYISNIRRKLAQKRLGDQLQVLACKNDIKYVDSKGQKWNVKNPIFVSIDRMAIAFAIAHGVSCIYSNASNLQMFYGSNNTTMERIIAGGSEVEKVKTGGRYIIDWELFKDDIKESPAHIMRLFMYSKGRAAGMVTRARFADSVDNSNILSLDYNDEKYIIRSYEDNAKPEQITVHDDGSNSLVYINQAGNQWKIIDNGNETYTLTKVGERINEILRLDELHGLMESGEVMDTMEGGGKNKEFLKTLAQYDLHMLCDEEQTRIWYDEFYTKDNGFTFHSPSFYELNAFFQALFKEDVDYMLIFPFLKNSSDPFSKAVLYAIERILDYMEISVPYDTKVDASSEAILVSVLEHAAEKSKEYGHSISTLKGSKLLNYLFEHNLTPLYFYNVFSEKYPVKIVSHTKVDSKQGISRKRRYNVNIPFERRVLVKAVGGKKKFKGSPRRKTLRKTRRHR